MDGPLVQQARDFAAEWEWHAAGCAAGVHAMTYPARMIDAPTSESGPYTWDDFVELEEDDLRELIDGELLEVEVPNGAHEGLVALLAYFLVGWARSSGGGRALGSGYKVRITDKRGVMPDLQFFRTGNLPRNQDVGLVSGHPDLAVEIVSPSSVRYDRVTKMRWYASIGVPEYWIVDPCAHTLERLVLEGDRYAIADALAEDSVFRPASFPGLEVPLAEWWRSAAEAPP
jgi:Uma2 family endonuclease